jgi:uncharacterized protein YuzE
MQISLSLRLDTARDRFVVELEPGDPDAVVEKAIAVEGMPEPVILELTETGKICTIAIPGLGKILKAIAGEPAGKPEGGKPGKPHR